MEGLSSHKMEVAAQLLVTMLAATPALVTELAELLGTLDEGESVFVDEVKDSTLRSQLEAFLTALGLRFRARDDETKADGVTSGFRCQRGGGWVLQTVAKMMDEVGLADPPAKDRAAAFEAAKEVVDGLARNEGMGSVGKDVSMLLEQILGGELVVLQGLPDARVRDALARLFSALGLESRETGEDEEIGYGVPERGATETKLLMEQVIRFYRGRGDREEKERQPGEEEEDEDEEAKSTAGPARRRAPIGPAMPSADMLAQAQHAAAQLVLQEESSSDDEVDDDDDDDAGPNVLGKEKRVASDSVRTPSAKRQRQEELKRAAEWQRARGVVAGSESAVSAGVDIDADASIKDGDAGGVREEWMLVPPKSLGVLGAIKTMQPRKFQARSRQTDEPRRAPKSKAELEADAAAEELLAKHREARGPSLVEQHRAEVSKAKKSAGRGKEGGRKPFFWSREEDMEQRRRFTPQMYEELVQKSHQLDSKFSRSFTSNFL